MWQPELGMFVVAPTTSFHPPHPHPDPNSLIPADPNHSVNVGVIPLLPSVEDATDIAGNRFRHGAIHLWHGQQPQPPRTINFDQNVSAVNALASGNDGGGTTTCQDCGNQAKKDCSHRRCRTCCKSRGLDCSTHVKSTWVSAARRRERRVITAGGASSGSNSGIKKPRLINGSQATTSHTSTSNTPPRSYDTGSSHQDAGLKDSLPGQVKAPAVFKCVRVTAVEDGEDEFAYQAVVKIGGHVFKGFLYDQGVQPGDHFPNLSDLHLGGGRGGGGGRNGDSSSSPLLDPSEVYGGSGGGFLGGSS